MVFTYFNDTNASDWSIADAYSKLEQETPLSLPRQLFNILNQELNKFITTQSVDQEKAAAALKLLQNWRGTKKQCMKTKSAKSVVNIERNYGTVNIQQAESSNATPTPPTLKRTLSDANTTGEWSWNSNDKAKKTKLLKVYLSDYYEETNFGIETDEDQWTVNDIKLTSLLKCFRDKSIQGALMRKPLSDERTLSLSFIFLISYNSKILSHLTTEEKYTVMNSLNLHEALEPIQDETVLTCLKLVNVLKDKTIDKKTANNKIDILTTESVNEKSKMAARIVSSLLNKFLSNSEKKDSESNLIIETLRPFLMQAVISPCEDFQFEWMTYRMTSYNNDGQLMIPDLALYITPISTVKFELLVVEVKKHGNFSNGNFENDMIKLGKEMKLALDKMIVHKVDNPVVVGVHIEGLKVTVMKMDLQYNAQYRLIEISSCYLVRNTVDDIMLIPTIIQNFDQARQIVQDVSVRVFKAIRKEICCTKDNTKFMRKVCQSPVTVKKE